MPLQWIINVRSVRPRMWLCGRRLHGTHHCDGSSMCDRSVQAYNFACGLRPHAKPYPWTPLACAACMVDNCAVGSNSRPPRLAALHGLWYVTVMRSGALEARANFYPWVDYKPSKEWLTTLYDNHKSDHQSYLSLFVQFRSGHSARRKEVMDMIRDEG